MGHTVDSVVEQSNFKQIEQTGNKPPLIAYIEQEHFIPERVLLCNTVISQMKVTTKSLKEFFKPTRWFMF